MNGVKRFGVAVLGTSLVFATARAQQEPGPIERAGEKIDQAGRNIFGGLERGFNRTRDAVTESFDRTRARVDDMNVEARVYGRIRWDKTLQSSPISLSSEARGIVTLRGSVPSEEARKRAVDLAADTVGVVRVVDQLVVPTAAVEVPTAEPAARPAPAARPRAARPGVER